ncbi:MAG: aldo/keto reductase [Enterococcus sp.]|uniref:aldo/keto reductase n=1 Tax=Enterococcus TaxID=1350 RepID=UPI00066777A4|nr:MULTISPECIES: aldo/keto reductase [Enterococcus]MDK7765400.1 aldo/keto reductase [Enterococcus faecalis]MDN6003451.1 aldo/keto reductase [Enterococcus sp.]MDN6560190.1 aldo/keto reductase [Enterococcus sp.]MDN6776488.1 aldo/keto reductase [Enterococcus sp.]MDN6828563.1 aldo/keto reductase [Enterococcus sp.]
MDYLKFGNTGLEVSKLCLGCMSFGVPERGNNPWSLNEEKSEPIIQRALELGINFFDTANMYSDGTSEEILGRALKKYAKREEIVVATKAYFPMFDGSNSKGLSRKSLFREIDQSLKRLGMDYVDLYVIHRWDYHTPIEETMKALHDLVQSGKVRYIGASTMYTWQFQKAQYIAEKNGWTKFVSMQNLVNLIYREEEREMLPYCTSEEIAITPWSPFAKGRLTRPVNEKTVRSANDTIGEMFWGSIQKADEEIIRRVGIVAEKYGVSRAQIALAWLLNIPEITAPIVGTTSLTQLEDSVKALEIKLSEEERQFLEEPYIPHTIYAG